MPTRLRQNDESPGTPTVAQGQEAERKAFERVRIENLLHFASLTPEQRVQWNWEIIQIMQAVKERRSAIDHR